MPTDRIIRTVSRELTIDDACRARAVAAGRDPVEYRLWEAGFGQADIDRVMAEQNIEPDAK